MDPNQTPPPPPPSDDEPTPQDQVPVEEEEAVEPEHPRRAASAEYIVEREVTSAVALREAMDPAHQSLTEALRLSYRVLQVVMVLLVVMFIVSGFKTVRENETGVQLLMGRIVGDTPEEQALTPGPKLSLAPYPAGDFLIFNETASVSLAGTEFFPNLEGRSLQDAIQNARTGDTLQPGQDGALLTEDGLVHLRMEAVYRIEDPVDFVNTLRLPEAGRVVKLALQSGAIEAAAALTVDEFVESEEAVAAEVQRNAQRLLDTLDSGIVLERVVATDLLPPFPIAQTFENLQVAVNQAASRRSAARQEYNEVLNQVAGEGHAELLELIEAYEAVAARDPSETGATDELEDIRARINELLLSDRISGEVAEMLATAQAYRTQVATRYGSDAQRFQALVEQYRANPSMVVRKLQLDALSSVLAREDAEIMQFPRGSGSIRVNIESSHDVRVARRRARQEQLEREAADATGLDMPTMAEFGEGPRQLNIDNGQVTGDQD